MSEIALARINSFAPVAQQTNVQPSEEPIFVLTSSQLQEIIARAITETIKPLQDRIDALEVTVAPQDEKLAALESTQETQADNQLIQLRLINDLREAKKEPESTKKIAAHIDELHRLMIEDKCQQIGIAKAARLLDLSKERVRQLKPLILADGRFDVGWSNLKGQKGAVIRIRQYLK